VASRILPLVLPFLFCWLQCTAQVSHRLFHHAGRFNHLRQEHLARAEQSHPTTFMPAINGPSITSIGRSALLARLFGILDKLVMPLIPARIPAVF
jgi:hypothetical protein